MAENKLSAREAALLAQARDEVRKHAAAGAPTARAEAAAPAVPSLPAATGASVAPQPAVADPAGRLAALMEAARAESARLRVRQRKLYVWAPVAFIALLGLWTLLWMWQRL